ncbi:MAG: N-acetylmuramic acid 6-phosphate etherase [Bacteroidia bacterium]|nr:N-acetylmuramic acid 6-phosphate etherase [Bacteroidia bacterium]
MSISELLIAINKEDSFIHLAIAKCMDVITTVTEECFKTLTNKGRIVYIGAGTSGRLGVLDAAECMPTFGIDNNTIIGIIAGGNKALNSAVENAEDDQMQAIADLQEHNFAANDIIIGLSASGTTPYVLAALRYARTLGAHTIGITNNNNSPMLNIAHTTIECIVGAEFIAGSTRMKAGTSQKLILNMISTSCMIKLGRTKGNLMTHLMPMNIKLKKRAANIISAELKVSIETAEALLVEYKTIDAVLTNYNK